VAIHPDDGLIDAVTVTDIAAVVPFIGHWNGTRNLYFGLNPTWRAMNKKPSKKDIARIEFICGDLDPRDNETADAGKARYTIKLAAFRPPPAGLIDSGNGLQGLWRLTTPIELNGDDAERAMRIKDAEARGKALLLALGAPTGTQNVDRILRLPGTINLPNAVKRRAGRVQCEASTSYMNGDACRLEELPTGAGAGGAGGAGRAAGGRGPGRPRTVRPLPQELIDLLSLTGPQPGGRNSRHEALWRFLHVALRMGVDENKIVESCLDASYAAGSIYQHVADNGGEDYVKRQIEKALNEPPADERGRTTITYDSGDPDMAWRATQDALIAHNCQVYMRGGGGGARRLVQPLWSWERSSSDEREVLTMGLEYYNFDRLADMIEHNAVRFQQYDGRSRRTKNIAAPDRIINRILNMGHYTFPTVIGVINAPTMRKDGSILTTEGYDKATKLWYKSSGEVVLPLIPERPTKEDAVKALDKLNGLLTEFPFEVKEGETREKCVTRSVALAGMMTTALRGALSVVPIFLINAPEARSGKTYLINLISIIAVGHIPPSTAGASEDRPDELDKRIETAAMSGRPIMHLNNMPNGMVLDSARLSELCTEGLVYVRKLGRHAEGTCDCRATTVFINGNNVTVASDLVTRVLMGRLDAQMANPETRVFKNDPIAMVRADRGAYLGAIFTIVRWWRTSGEPTPTGMHKVLGFEGWSKMVQEPLMALGMADPYGNLERMRTTDVKRDEFLRLLTVLRALFAPTDKFTTAMLTRKAEEPNSGGGYRYPELRELMIVNGRINGESFGRLLKKHVNRRDNDGWSYTLHGTLGGSLAYRLCGPQSAQQAEEQPF
jgi:hypothetical protein